MGYLSSLRDAGDQFASPRRLSKVARRRSLPIRTLVARNPSASPDTLVWLSKRRAAGVREAVADNPLTPPEVLAKLSRDKDRAVKTSVALNSSTPAQSLVAMAADADGAVRQAVAMNPNLPVHVLEELCRDSHTAVRETAELHLRMAKLRSDSEALESKRQRRPAPRARKSTPGPTTDRSLEPDVRPGYRNADGTPEGGLWQQPPKKVARRVTKPDAEPRNRQVE